MSDKQFCGSGKIIKTQYGDLYKLSFTTKDLGVLSANLENGWVNATMKAKKEPQAGKPSHYLEIDNWKPSQDVQTGHKPEPEDDDLPF